MNLDIEFEWSGKSQFDKKTCSFQATTTEDTIQVLIESCQGMGSWDSTGYELTMADEKRLRIQLNRRHEERQKATA